MRTVALGQNGTFLCDKNVPAWQFTFKNGSSVTVIPSESSADRTQVFDGVRGIIFTYEGELLRQRSILIIRGSELNNGTLICCKKKVSGAIYSSEENQFKFQVYGKELECIVIIMLQTTDTN